MLLTCYFCLNLHIYGSIAQSYLHFAQLIAVLYRTKGGTSLSVHDNFGTYTFGTYEISVQSTSVHKMSISVQASSVQNDVQNVAQAGAVASRIAISAAQMIEVC